MNICTLFLSLGVIAISRKSEENISRVKLLFFHCDMARFRLQPKARKPRAKISKEERKSRLLAQQQTRSNITLDIIAFQQQIAEASHNIASKYRKTPLSILQRLHAGSRKTLLHKGKPTYTAWHAFCSYETKASNNGAQFAFRLARWLIIVTYFRQGCGRKVIGRRLASLMCRLQPPLKRGEGSTTQEVRK